MPAGGSGLCSQLPPCSGAHWLCQQKALSAGLPVAHVVPAEGRACHALGRADAALAIFGLCYLGCASEARCCLMAPCQRRQGCTSPLVAHWGHPVTLLVSPPLVHPLEVALWCDSHRAGRRGLVRGHRSKELRMAVGWPRGTAPTAQHLRHSTCARMCLSPAKGLPRGSTAPSPRTCICRNTDAFSLLEAPDPPPDVHLYLSRRSCRDGAAGRAETPQHPPCGWGLSPQSRACCGEWESLHTGTPWLSPAR